MCHCSARCSALLACFSRSSVIAVCQPAVRHMTFSFVCVHPCPSAHQPAGLPTFSHTQALGPLLQKQTPWARGRWRFTCRRQAWVCKRSAPHPQGQSVRTYTIATSGTHQLSTSSGLACLQSCTLRVLALTLLYHRCQLAPAYAPSFSMPVQFAVDDSTRPPACRRRGP